MRRILLLVLLVLALSPACGGDDDDGASGAAAVDVDADRAGVRRAIDAYRTRMEAQSFVATADDDSDDDFEFTSEECKRYDELFGEDEDLPGQTASEDGPDYERGTIEEGGTETVNASVGFTDDPDKVDDLLGLLRRDEFETCMEEAFRGGFAKEAEGPDSPKMELQDFTVATTEPDIGDNAIALRMTTSLRLTELGISFDIAFDVVAAREGRAAVLVADALIGNPEQRESATDLVTFLLDQATTG